MCCVKECVHPFVDASLRLLGAEQHNGRLLEFIKRNLTVNGSSRI